MNNMDNHNILEELKEAYKSYKKGEYTFGKYWTGDQIEKAFLDGKIFVLKGSIKIFLPIVLLIVIPVFVFFFIMIIDEEYFIISISISIPLAGFLILIVCVTIIRWFVVVGPSGVYYRNVIKRGYFQWKSVTLIKAG
ncbi:MAG: hypothetical protein ACFE78_13420, partial [Candidatus Hodarchaeota archaeon]